ncbi:hypothetical protein K1T71_009574 [Dendrolimus kikuchii]|uniref:Uncharacterized protein n=1 Tax=Dendrolimus kikuchii TaxID=765133 RepID=A0ACC1CS47_9NEOP|nr:hypothetical protein K1T71_009574 [Dendrolimus kikuchii]
MKYLILLVISLVYTSKSYTFVEENSCPCQGLMNPVCASDGKTYWSEECAKCFNPQLTITRRWFCPRLDIELEG